MITKDNNWLSAFQYKTLPADWAARNSIARVYAAGLRGGAVVAWCGEYVQTPTYASSQETNEYSNGRANGIYKAFRCGAANRAALRIYNRSQQR